MSFTLSSTKHDATLSKTLIEGKHKLGAVYFEARLIECPKNAIELKNLLKKYDKIEKEYIKDVSEVKRNQQMLNLSLTNYIKSDKSSMSQEILGQTRAEALSIPPPPGFRFRSNGQPKQLQLKSPSDSIDSQLCFQSSYLWQKPKSSSMCHSRSIGMSDIHVESLRGNESVITSDKVSSEDRTPSLDNQKRIQDVCCNARFAFKPGSINFGKSDGKILRLRKSIRSSLRPACSACQFKLKYSDEALQKMQLYQKEPLIRWQIAPKGRYVKAPFSYHELEKMMSQVQFPSRQSRSPGNNSVQTAPNSLDIIVEANQPSDLTDQLKYTPSENRRLASSAALTSVLRSSFSEKRKSAVASKESHIDNSIYTNIITPYDEKRSSVSFSPSVIGLHSNTTSENKEHSSSDTAGNDGNHSPPYRPISYLPCHRQLSVQHWRPILEEERIRSVLKIEEFLEKLPGDSAPRGKSKNKELLPWARQKTHGRLVA